MTSQQRRIGPTP